MKFLDFHHSNVAVEMVAAGLAICVRHKRDDQDRASEYDAMMMAETK